MLLLGCGIIYCLCLLGTLVLVCLELKFAACQECFENRAKLKVQLHIIVFMSPRRLANSLNISKCPKISV